MNTNTIKRKYNKTLSTTQLILMEDMSFMYQIGLLKKSDTRRTEFFPEIDQITETIYLGNADGSREKKSLKDKEITHILVCGDLLLKHYPDDFIYYEIPAEDNFKENIAYY